MILQIIYCRSRNHYFIVKDWKTGTWENVDSNLLQACNSGLKQNYSFLCEKIRQ